MGYWSDVSIEIDDAARRLREALHQLVVLRGFKGSDLVDDFEAEMDLVKEEIARARAEFTFLELRYGLENLAPDYGLDEDVTAALST